MVCDTTKAIYNNIHTWVGGACCRSLKCLRCELTVKEATCNRRMNYVQLQKAAHAHYNIAKRRSRNTLQSFVTCATEITYSKGETTACTDGTTRQFKILLLLQFDRIQSLFVISDDMLQATVHCWTNMTLSIGNHIYQLATIY